MNEGLCGVDFHEIADSLLNKDPYMVLADFADYDRVRQRSSQLYASAAAWQKMCLVNIAKAGRFAADRAVREYAENIWHAKPVPENKA